jgi:hypothetical protein
VQASNPDGVALLAVTCAPFIDALRTLDYTPPSFFSLNCIDNAGGPGASRSERNFISGAAQWEARLDTSEYTESKLDPWSLFGIDAEPTATNRARNADVTSPSPRAARGSGSSEDTSTEAVPLTSNDLFVAAWQRAYNSSSIPGYTYVMLVGSFTMLHAAIVLANSTSALLVNAQLTDMSAIPSFYGPMETRPYGYNQRKPILILQQDARGMVQIVAPIQFATADFVFPAPLWKERVYEQRVLGLSVERIFVVLVVLCSCVTLCLLLSVLVCWRDPLFRATGPFSYCCVAVGSIAGYCNVLVWPVDNSSTMCAARTWLVVGAFHAVLQPLFFAVRRVHLICETRDSLQATAAKRSLFSRCFPFLLSALPLLLTLLRGMPVASVPLLIVPDPLRPGASAFTVCVSTASDGRTAAILGAHLALGACLLLATCYYAYRIRAVSGVFHDAHALAYSTYIFALSALCIVISQSVLGSGASGQSRAIAELSFALRAAGLLLGYQTTVAVLIGSRVRCCVGLAAAAAARKEQERTREAAVSRIQGGGHSPLALSAATDAPNAQADFSLLVPAARKSLARTVGVQQQQQQQQQMQPHPHAIVSHLDSHLAAGVHSNSIIAPAAAAGNLALATRPWYGKSAVSPAPNGSSSAYATGTMLSLSAIQSCGNSQELIDPAGGMLEPPPSIIDDARRSSGSSGRGRGRGSRGEGRATVTAEMTTLYTRTQNVTIHNAPDDSDDTQIHSNIVAPPSGGSSCSSGCACHSCPCALR